MAKQRYLHPIGTPITPAERAVRHRQHIAVISCLALSFLAGVFVTLAWLVAG